MNALAQIPARRLDRSTFEAWRHPDGSKLACAHTLVAVSLPAIEREIAIAPHFGATILILETDAITDAKLLHAYRIRRGKWIGRVDERGCKTYPHSADLLFRMPVNAFDPVQPWGWSPGCDVVGLDPVLEGVRV